MTKEFSHLKDGQPSMVDVTVKQVTRRMARARATVILGEALIGMLESEELYVPKGPVFQTAILAGIMAAKKTGDLIPLCHPLPLSHCQVSIKVEGIDRLHIECVAQLDGKTGVEMEALTGVSLAALTVYDMCKSLSHDIQITDIMLMEKTGGKEDFIREL
ncbi:MAG: cyclic pyranopterin monophosphate synthase MoaC [Lewinellaceae bacterium]|mgnify:CR=1 FL=1|nr:cyclic pyranopterin monophosphate synthase MoaC [Lewinellaceae bacterium]